MAGRRQLIMRPDAAATIEELCADQLAGAAGELARAIPAQVPVNQGVAQRVYQQALKVERQDDGSAHVTGFPFLWHWLEYGTSYNPAYRPIENAARALGFTWEGH